MPRYFHFLIGKSTLRSLQLHPEVVSDPRQPGQDSPFPPEHLLLSLTFREKDLVPPGGWIQIVLSTKVLRPRIQYLQRHRISVSPIHSVPSHVLPPAPGRKASCNFLPVDRSIPEFPYEAELATYADIS